MTEQIQTITVTREQSCILVALQYAAGRLRTLLEGIAKEAGESLAYANLDTGFLVGRTDQIRGVVAEFDAFRDVARWVGCEADHIKAAVAADYVCFDGAA